MDLRISFLSGLRIRPPALGPQVTFRQHLECLLHQRPTRTSTDVGVLRWSWSNRQYARSNDKDLSADGLDRRDRRNVPPQSWAQIARARGLITTSLLRHPGHISLEMSGETGAGRSSASS